MESVLLVGQKRGERHPQRQQERRKGRSVEVGGGQCGHALCPRPSGRGLRPGASEVGSNCSTTVQMGSEMV